MSDHLANSIHFYLLTLIIKFFSVTYLTLSEISYASSCCLNFRKLDNMSRSRELDSQDDNPNRHATS